MVSLTVVGPGRYQLNPPLSPLAIFAQKISPHFTFQLKELLCCEIAYSMITIKVRYGLGVSDKIGSIDAHHAISYFLVLNFVWGYKGCMMPTLLSRGVSHPWWQVSSLFWRLGQTREATYRMVHNPCSFRNLPTGSPIILLVVQKPTSKVLGDTFSSITTKF